MKLKTKYHDLEINNTEFGLTFWCDGRIQSCDYDYEEYHNALVSPEMKDGKALVIGAGEGILIDKLIKQNNEVTAIDLDLELIGFVKENLGKWNNDIYSSGTEFKIIIGRAEEVIENLQHKYYDNIIFDLTESGRSDPCYTVKFLSQCYLLLKDKGLFSYQDGDIEHTSKMDDLVHLIFGKPIKSQTRDWRFGQVRK